MLHHAPHPAAMEALAGFAPQAQIEGVRGDEDAYWQQICLPLGRRARIW